MSEAGSSGVGVAGPGVARTAHRCQGEGGSLSTFKGWLSTSKGSLSGRGLRGVDAAGPSVGEG
ncbi:MAG: hypothetical protein NVS1B4_23570 [Gemmatimonadaceae bacterium]